MIRIESLSSENVNDYFNFFENQAFADPGHICYCTVWNTPENYNPNEEYRKLMLSTSGNKCSFRMYMREFAEKLIQSGHIHGYLAYSDGHAVGWCNAGDRSGYSYLGRHVDTKNMSDKTKVMAIACIEIAPKYRNMGVASELLKYVLKDSLNSGYEVVEAYPNSYEFISYDYYKYLIKLYENLGFREIKGTELFCIMSKNLI